MNQSGVFIIEPFNKVFFAVFLIFFFILFVATRELRKRSIELRSKAVIVASFFTICCYFLYKYSLSLDAEFNIATEAIGGFNWWGELPLHLCNVNMILLPIAVFTKKKPLLGFCFFVGPLGAIMALTMPGLGFSGYSILLPRMIGYYGTHFMVVILGLSLVTLGLYSPRFKDIPTIVLATIGIAFIAFVISLALRITELNTHANYFFSIETEDNPILDMLYSKIPIPFVYLLPTSIILFVYMMIITTAYNLFKKKIGAIYEQHN